MNFEQIKVFLKDSLLVFIVGIIYILICSNSIALVKIFPYTTIEKTQCQNITFLDYIYPTDLEQPPYQRSETTCHPPPKPYIPSNTDCGYQGVDYAKKFGEMYSALKDNLGEVHWPYDWLKEDPDKSNWANYWQKFKIANMILNQCYSARWIMKSFLGLHFFRYIPDFILFLVLPLAGTTSSLSPILPTIIYFVSMLTLPILILVTIATWIITWFPSGKDIFQCKDTSDPKNKDESRCIPNIWYQLLMFFLQGLGLWLTSWTGQKLKEDWGMFWHSIFWGILCIMCFSLFIWSGGFLLGIGLISATIVFMGTILSTFYPLFLSPSAIFNIFYCNKDIIALILTAIITIRAQEQKTLNSNIVNTMWGVWGVLLIMKILILINGSISG